MHGPETLIGDNLKNCNQRPSSTRKNKNCLVALNNGFALETQENDRVEVKSIGICLQNIGSDQRSFSLSTMSMVESVLCNICWHNLSNDLCWSQRVTLSVAHHGQDLVSG